MNSPLWSKENLFLQNQRKLSSPATTTLDRGAKKRMDKLSFIDILSESFQISRIQTRLFVFGFFIALPLAVETVFLQTDGSLTLEKIQLLTSHSSKELTIFFVVALLSSLIGKSGLITMIDRLIRKKEHALSFPSLASLFRTTFRALRIDLVVIFFLISYLCILFLPVFLAALGGKAVPSVLYTFIFFAFLPVMAIVFLLREFTYYYFLLSPLAFLSSLRNAVNFFLRYQSACFSFGLFFLFLTALFTFSANLVMLGIVVLSEKFIPQASMPLLFVGSFILAWYGILRQTLWLLFFHTLATPKEHFENESTSPLKKESLEVPTV